MPSTTTSRLQGLTTSVAVKAPCRVATTANITLSGTQTIDGVAVVADDRVLVKDQTDATENGIYDASATAWARSRDFNGTYDAVDGTQVFITDGTVSAGFNFQVDVSGDIVFGTTSISFSDAAITALTTTLESLERNIFVAPYSADNTGATSASTILDTAITDAYNAGGGVVSGRGGRALITAAHDIKPHVMLKGWYDGRSPMRQATDSADNEPYAGVWPNTGMVIEHGEGGGTDASDATFNFASGSNAGGIESMLFAYGNQERTNSQPDVFSPTIGIDGVKLGMNFKNIQLYNSYIGFKFDDNGVSSDTGGGFTLIDNITMTPLYRGFWMDRQREGMTIRNTKFWKFWAPNGDTGTLADWIHANSVCFYLGFIDAVTITDVSSYNVKSTFHLYDNGNGQPWVNISDYHCDSNREPVVIDDVNNANFNNGFYVGNAEAGSTDDGNAAIHITENMRNDRGSSNFSNQFFYNITHAVDVAAPCGQFNFNNLMMKGDTSAVSGPPRYDANAVQSMAFVNQGNGAQVRASNLSYAGNHAIESFFGSGENTTLDGLTLPNRGTYDVNITGATAANPVVITATSHGLSDGDVIFVHNALGMTELNGIYYTIASSTANTYELSGIDGTAYTAYTSGGTVLKMNDFGTRLLDQVITGVTQANPAVVTVDATVANDLKDGEKITIASVVGMTELNGNTYTVNYLTSTTFELVGINSTAYTAYTSGGTITKVNDFGVNGWDDIANWGGTGTANVSNITDGLQFDASATAAYVTFQLPNDVRDERIGVMEFELEQTFSAEVSSGCQFTVQILDGSGNITTNMLDTGFVPHYENKRRYIFPIIIPSGGLIQITSGDQSSGTATINMTNMKITRPDREYITESYLDYIYGTERFQTTLGKLISIENGKKKTLRTVSDGAPVAGTWEFNDEVLYTNHSTDSKGLVCTTAGTGSSAVWRRTGTVELTGSFTWDPPSLADGTGGVTSNITITGAELGDFVIVSAPYDLQAVIATGYISAADTANIRVQNETGGTVDLASGTWLLKVLK